MLHVCQHVWNTRLLHDFGSRLFPQLRTVLHQLLQREAAAALHPAGAEAGAGGVPTRGDSLEACKCVCVWEGGRAASLVSNAPFEGSRLKGHSLAVKIFDFLDTQI